MPDYAAPLQHFASSRTLWLIVAWPIAGAAWQALVARRLVARASSEAAARSRLASAQRAAVGFVALTGVATLAHAGVLARTPPGAHALFEHVATGARVGCLNADIDLWFDPLAAAFCSLACLVALAAAVAGAGAVRERAGRAQGEWLRWTWLQASLAGALVAFLSGGFVGTAMGWAIAGVASAALSGWGGSVSAGAARAARHATGTCALLVGAALLFWGLGGSWEGDEYVPEIEPRLTPVRVVGRSDGAASDEGAGWASLTLDGVFGAVVTLDGERTPFARAPFEARPLRAGKHTVRVRFSGEASDDVTLRLAFESGREIALVAFGPTLTFRDIADQLATRDREGHAVALRELEARVGPGGTLATAAAIVAFLVAAWAMSGGRPPTGAPWSLRATHAAATTAMLGPYALARLAFLFPLVPHTWIAVQSIGAAGLLSAAWYAPTLEGAVSRRVAFAGALPSSLTLLALGAAGVVAATYTAIVTGVGAGALHLAAALAPPPRARDELPARETVDELLFVRAPDRLGALVADMDTWVVGAVAAAIAAAVRAAGWTLAALDAHVVAAPAAAMGAGLGRARRRLEPVVGVRLGRLVWALLAAAAAATVAYTLWSRR